MNESLNDPPLASSTSSDRPVAPPFVERRLERHLDAMARRTAIPAAEPSSARRRAHQRTIARRRAVVGALAAASVVGVVAGVATLARPEPSTIQTLGDPAVGADPDTTSQPVADPTTTAIVPNPAAATEVATPARLEPPAFVWKAVEPAKDKAIGGTFFGPGASMLPTYATSTAPGRSNDDDDVEQFVWRTDDGIEWERTDIESPFAQSFWAPQFVGDTVFAVGTAPGIAGTEPNPLLVGVNDGAAAGDWRTAELAYDTNEYRDLPMAFVGLEIERVTAGEQLLIALTPHVTPDYQRIEWVNGDPVDSQIFDHVDGGIRVIPSEECAELIWGTVPTTIAGNPIEQASTTMPPGCEPVRYTWEELGVPAETIAAMNELVTRVFAVGPDLTVTEIEPPEPGALLRSLGTTSGRFVERPEMLPEAERASAAVRAWEYDGAGGWTTVTIPAVNWSQEPMTVGDATYGFAFPSDGAASGGGTVVRLGADGSVSRTDLRTILDADYPFVQSMSSATAAGRFVAAVDQYPDAIADAGGVETTVGSVTIRKASDRTDYEFFDAATGEVLDGVTLDWIGSDETDARAVPAGTAPAATVSEGTAPAATVSEGGGFVRIVDADGTVLGEAGEQEFYDRLEGSLMGDPPRPPVQRIVTTANGVDFTSESVAELVGMDDADVSRVQHITSDGTQVFVAVALEDRWSDDTRKQVVLVGTPID